MEKVMPKSFRYMPFKFYCGIPPKYKDKLFQELSYTNLVREKILSIALIIIDLPLLYKDVFISKLYISSVLLRNSFYVHIVLLIVPSIFLIVLYISKRMKFIDNPVFRRIMHISINMLVLILCSFMAMVAWTQNELPFSYVIAMFCIASTVFLNPCERVLFYFLSHGYYITGLLVIEENNYKLIENISFSTLLLILALIVSKLNFSRYVQNFVNNKIILEQKQELANMYKITKETLEIRTRELAEAVEYEKLRTAFFANISHELRTPLTVIFSAEQMLDYILKKEEFYKNEKKVSQYMNMIKQNCYRLIRLISNLIDTTKIDSGYFSISLKNCDIVKVVEDITQSVGKFIEDKDINLVFDTEVEEKIIACDVDKIERIMLNLLSNAVKFTPAGGSIYVSMYERDEKIFISVKDTGIGIPYNMQKLIFEKFVQVNETISKNREGSGIGLSLVKSIVEMHGGTISLVSEPGNGSEFTIGFPNITLPTIECTEGCQFIERDSVERINIEFSDIYSNKEGAL